MAGRGRSKGGSGRISWGSPVDLGLEGLRVRTALPATGHPPLGDRGDMQPVFVEKRTCVGVQTEDEQRRHTVLSSERWKEDLRAFSWRLRQSCASRGGGLKQRFQEAGDLEDQFEVLKIRCVRPLAGGLNRDVSAYLAGKTLSGHTVPPGITKWESGSLPSHGPGFGGDLFQLRTPALDQCQPRGGTEGEIVIHPISMGLALLGPWDKTPQMDGS